MYEMNLLGERRPYLREHFVDQIFRTYHSGVDTAHNLFQKFNIAFFRAHNTFPVPLVNV